MGLHIGENRKVLVVTPWVLSYVERLAARL